MTTLGGTLSLLCVVYMDYLGADDWEGSLNVAYSAIVRILSIRSKDTSLSDYARASDGGVSLEGYNIY